MPKTEDKLDIIIEHLQRMDKRDRLRTWGAAFKGLIGLIPAIAFIVAAWYLYEHGDEVLMKVAKTAAEQAAQATKTSTEGIIDQIKNFQVR